VDGLRDELLRTLMEARRGREEQPLAKASWDAVEAAAAQLLRAQDPAAEALRRLAGLLGRRTDLRVAARRYLAERRAGGPAFERFGATAAARPQPREQLDLFSAPAATPAGSPQAVPGGPLASLLGVAEDEDEILEALCDLAAGGWPDRRRRRALAAWLAPLDAPLLATVRVLARACRPRPPA
jgi:hypothetical protein